MSYYIGLSILSNNTGSPPKRDERQKLLSAEARRVLSLLESSPVKDGDFAKDEKGRPFFPGSHTDFNISHSGALAAVSLARGEEQRTGCDVQIVRPKTKTLEIADYFFSAGERDFVRSGGNRFFQIWTLKESYLKLRGLSVFDMQTVPSFIGKNGTGCLHFSFGSAVSVPLSFYLHELTGPAGEQYLLAAAFEGHKQIQPEIRWFSESPLPCRSIAAINAAPSPARTVSPKM